MVHVMCAQSSPPQGQQTGSGTETNEEGVLCLAQVTFSFSFYMCVPYRLTW